MTETIYSAGFREWRPAKGAAPGKRGPSLPGGRPGPVAR